jgi:hypothetical protein
MAAPSDSTVFRATTTAPVNIAVIKFVVLDTLEKHCYPQEVLLLTVKLKILG